MLGKKMFIVAVSGGVDSVTLLHMLHTRKGDDVAYVVAHFNHGIREDSSEDELFVKKLADDYGMEYETEAGKLGTNASEDEARKARYEFLRRVAERYNAERIITAHHKDDVIETMILNLIRGTSPRGLQPMRAHEDLLRPLVHKSKQELVDYANEHGLQWREDSTNSDERYLRNYIRHNIMPELSDEHREVFISHRNLLGEIYDDVDIRIKQLLPQKNILNRAFFVSLPYILQRELIRAWLTKIGLTEIDAKTIQRVVLAVKTLAPGKQIPVKSGLILASHPENVMITSS